jgi:hypothetical protein
MSDLFGVWQPIDTAPRDGSWVLLSGGKCVDEVIDTKPRPVVGQWTTYLNSGTTSGNWQFAWYDGGCYGEYENPTHWMALPELERNKILTVPAIESHEEPAMEQCPNPCQCGSKKIMIGDCGGESWWMQCQSCGIKIDSNNMASEAERIAAWNLFVDGLKYPMAFKCGLCGFVVVLTEKWQGRPQGPQCQCNTRQSANWQRVPLPGGAPAASEHRPTKTEFLSARFDDFLASSELITRLEIEES